MKIKCPGKAGAGTARDAKAVPASMASSFAAEHRGSLTTGDSSVIYSASVCVSASAIFARGFAATELCPRLEERGLEALLQMYSGTARGAEQDLQFPKASSVSFTPGEGFQSGPGPGMPSTQPSTDAMPQRLFCVSIESASSAITKPPATRVRDSSVVSRGWSSVHGPILMWSPSASITGTCIGGGLAGLQCSYQLCRQPLEQ